MKHFLRLLVFGIVGLAIVLGGGALLLSRNAPRSAPTVGPLSAPIAAEADTAPTAVPKGYVSRALLGEQWPLTVEYGDLACEGQAVTFRSPMGDTYAVNAPARSQMKAKGWRDILSIDTPGADLSLLIDAGLGLC
jgi:uncharacterized protein DUF2511